MTDFAWLIEAPGPTYLSQRTIAHYPEFHWTREPTKALRFFDEAQCDGVLETVRRLAPSLFAFEVNLGNALARQHGWLSESLSRDPPGATAPEALP